jgi:hypothetical protein
VRAHGTHTRYVNGPDENDVEGRGCHCTACRRAASDYERQRTQRTEPSYVIAGPAREHIAWLATQGVGLKSVARITGIGHGTLSKLIYGDRTRQMPPSRRIRPATAEKILAVTPAHAPAGTRIPAGPVHEQVARLVAAGVPKARIAERIGQTGPGLQLGKRMVTRAHADAIRSMIDELDAGVLVTVKRSRYGDQVIAPPATENDTPATDDTDDLLLAFVEMLEERIDERDWRQNAACRGRPSWLFFPARGDKTTLQMAKRVCAACIVRDACLTANLDEPVGIYAGTSPKQRRRIRLERRRAA